MKYNTAEKMKFIKKAILGLLIILGLNLITILIFNYKINRASWKYADGKDYIDWIEFDESYKVKGAFVCFDDKIVKIVIFYCGSNLIICDTNFLGWTEYVNKGG